MKKKAQWTGPELAARGIAGAVGGGLFGRYATPNILGYQDNPHAVNMSTLLDASLASAMAIGAPHYRQWIKDPTMAAKLLATIGVAELAPVGMNLAMKGTDAAKELTGAAAGMKDLPITQQIKNVATSPEGKGALTGAAGAGIGAMLTGLLRARSQGEVDSGATRPGMVTKDFLKYLIPALLAGGLAGNVLKDRKPSSPLS